MTESTLKIFVDGVSDYFRQAMVEQVEVHAPYLEKGPLRLLDYSAVIGISGGYRGCVYFTAASSMLRTVLKKTGETSDDPDLLADLAGEMANIISGNARRELGEGFAISVPTRLRGQPKELAAPGEGPVFVIPIVWRGERSELIVCLN
ncbi:MAG TPA: chemotaxis protein CheX [Opitutaceae bacterium]|jgi:chemotaxis protein CheX|nr:chemotaxis protein CheX [Opitutaceae bacterium]